MGDIVANDLKRTPLHALHEALGAKFAPFAGYEMPIQYPGGILAEHHHVREKAGLFDVSHMGQGFLTPVDWDMGPDASDADHAATSALLEELTPSDLAGLERGEMRYSLLLNDDGGVEDDFMVARAWTADSQGMLFLVVNAACKDADFDLIDHKLKGRANLLRAEHRALLALQGPKATDVAAQICPAANNMVFMNARRMPTTIDGVEMDTIWSRSGYTGEDGFEISVPTEHARLLADALLAHNDVKPIGLGARDSLRLEAGLCLY
ncbi:MAG: glycine cleavage system protein T, partial [Pseudomonadota bacterium]